MTGTVLVEAIILWIVPAFVAASQGRAKHRSGLAYGLLGGWIGVIILALLPPLADDRYRECPYCREAIRVDAVVCPHCRRSVTDGLPGGVAGSVEN